MNAIFIIKEAEYAIMILDALYRGEILSAAEIAEMKEIPSPFIYRVLKKMAVKDLIGIKRGPKGGYYLKADCSRLTLYDVIKVFDNTFVVTECLTPGYECVHNSDSMCRVHKEFAYLQHRLQTEFKKRSISSLLEEDDK